MSDRGVVTDVDPIHTSETDRKIPARKPARSGALHEQTRGIIRPTDFHGLLGSSTSMTDIVSLIQRVARCDANVLLQGESGTGKELIARAIHATSPRGGKPFVVINCTTIVDSLMESELFGHERGAFTGAVERKAGKFEAADKGTVFLDEISELPLPLQPKMLRIIQDKTFTRVGGTRSLNTDIRIVAATNQDIRGMVRERKFREDLYYRLKVVQLWIPPLRDRPTDIPTLANHFLKLYAIRYNRPTRSISKDAMSLLLNFTWPGNVRDLEHTIERAVVMCRGGSIEAKDISFEGEFRAACNNSWNYETALAEFNKNFLSRALSMTNGNKREAARLIDISHARLYRIIKKCCLSEKSE